MIDHTLWLPYTQMKTAREPLEIVRTEGEYLITEQGEQLVDAIGSWWTSCHGYNHPTIIKAIQEQAHTMPHVMLGGIQHPQAKRLAHRLKKLLPGNLNHVFLANTGSESVEISLKIAIQFWLNQGQARNKFVSFKHAYHGDTLFAMSVCDPEEGMHHLFHQALPQQWIQTLPETEGDFDYLDRWLSKNKNDIAGIIIEPLIQGAGGMKMHTPDTLKKMHQLCKSHDLLFIVDEIFTGFGRTGSFFAIEQAGIVPDIICLSKALTGGTLPLAAVVVTDAVYDVFLSDNPDHALMHGPTFMGNALACSAANASLDLFETTDWQTNVKRIETHLEETLHPLAQLSQVKQIRVKGAVGAVQLQQPIENSHQWFVERFLESGVWLRPFGDIVYTTPCFNISNEGLSRISTSICEHIHDYNDKNLVY